jgi:hypothetical protein
MAMTAEPKKENLDLDHLLHPAGSFRTPSDVVTNPALTMQEKRAILASWASDVCAVEASPGLRRPPGAPIVEFDAVMDALKQLDGEAVATPHYNKFISRARRLKELYRSDQGRPSIFAWG